MNHIQFPHLSAHIHQFLPFTLRFLDDWEANNKLTGTLNYLISDSQVIRDSLSHFGKKINRLTGNKRLTGQIGK